MKPPFTPGPWKIEIGNCGNLAGLVGGTGEAFALLGRADALKPADVALILQSPQMFALLEEIPEKVPSVVAMHPWFHEVFLPRLRAILEAVHCPKGVRPFTEGGGT